MTQILITSNGFLLISVVIVCSIFEYNNAQSSQGIVNDEHGSSHCKSDSGSTDSNLVDCSVPHPTGTFDAAVPKPVQVHTAQKGTQVATFDDVFGLTNLLMLERYTDLAGTWRYRRCDRDGLAPWENPLNPKNIASTKFGHLLQRVVAYTSGQINIGLYRIDLNIVRRQDPMKVFFGSDTIGEEHIALLYMNRIWRKNDYGDALFYEKDQDLAVASIKPRFGRLIVWDSTIGLLARPPSSNVQAGQLIVVARFTTNQTRITEWQARYEADVAEREMNNLNLFSSMSVQEEVKKDVGQHLVKHFMSPTGKKIFVFDDLFVNADLKKIYDNILLYGDYYYDDSYDLDSDNVVWIAAFSIDDFVSSSLWPIIQEIASFSSGKDSWFPYDISCNVVRSADHTRIHEDCEEHEEEWTFLLYLNPDWSPDYYGETVFFETTQDDSEVIGTVLPKFGRAVIFEGIIPHSARPPSSIFNGTRLSFAVKLSVTEEIARKKMILQHFQHELATHETILNILKYYQHPEFEQGIKESLIDNVNEQRNVDLRLSAYSFGGVSTEDHAETTQGWEYGRKEEDEGMDDEDEGMDEDDEKENEEFEIIKQRKEYIYNVLKTSAEEPEELKQHYLQFTDKYKSFIISYSDKLLDVL